MNSGGMKVFRLGEFASIKARTDALVGDEWKGGTYNTRFTLKGASSTNSDVFGWI
jgi:hypothetical protein